MFSLVEITPAETAFETDPSASGAQSSAELVVLADDMTTLVEVTPRVVVLEPTVSSWPVPSDSTEGLVHEVPHAAVDAPADRLNRRLTGTIAVTISAATAR
jgi:hypothetical protein